MQPLILHAMDKTKYIIPLLLSVVVALLSCSSSDDTYTYSNDCYIKSMVLGQLRRTVTTKTASGDDTTYTVSFTGSYYPLAINQVKQTITSSVPLPVGTRISAVLVSATFDGVMLYAPAADTTEWKAYSSSDSIDFSSPVVFRVYSSDLTGYRDYTASLTVLQSDPTDYGWTQKPDASMLAGRNAIKLALFKDKIIAMSQDDAGQCYIATKGDDDLWIEQTCSGIVNAQISTLQCYEDKLWLSTTDGQLLSSADGVVWAPVSITPTFNLHLLATSSSALYASAMSPGATAINGIYTSADGMTWTIMDVEDNDYSAFPTKQVTSVAYQHTNDMMRVLVAGQTADEKATAVWSLSEGLGSPWTLFSITGDNRYTLDALQSMSIVDYNNQLIALGGKSVDDSGHTALDNIYISYDNGITWQASDVLTAPTELQGSEEAVTAVVQGSGIWVVAGSQVWRVGLNSMQE